MRLAERRPAEPETSLAAWHEKASEVLARLGVDADAGLSSTEAAARLQHDGPNELPESPPEPGWRRLARQFTSTMILVLLGAAGITIAIGDLKDATVILTVVTLNASIGAWQEGRATQAMAALKRVTMPTARVVRDGRTATVATRELVRGDVLEVARGDIVGADARLFEANGLRVDESSLTGESVAVDKRTAPVPAAALVADRSCILFKGTSVVAGSGRAVVVETGARTEFGAIASLLRAHTTPRTPLERRLARLGRSIALAALAACAVVFAVGVSQGGSATTMLVTAVSLAVAAIPEALPAVVTISLALGAQRMARHRAVIRKLPAVETLGSVTVIATDKTGTLTQGRMVARVIQLAGTTITVTGNEYEPAGELLREGLPIETPPHGALRDLLEACVLCNDATLLPPHDDADVWSIAGDPTEAALLVLAAKAGIERRGLERRLHPLATFPFDARRKRMSAVHATDARIRVSVKGAPEAVLPHAVRIATTDGVETIDPERRHHLESAARKLAADGYRVLAVAGADRDTEPSGHDEAEDGLTLFGFVGLLDPPRPEVAAAVAIARRAGITPVMITGDHIATAGAIASSIGIDGARTMTGMELASRSNEGLADQVADIAVYARTTPEQKLDIVRAWQAHGDIVAMSGDGINDAPALQRADIGIAMGISGTEVSKHAADLVLADDNFATIVTAVAEGRRIYDNIRRFVRYGLTGGSAEVWVMLFAGVFGLPLPLLPAQILWVNLVTHGLPGLGLGMEPAEPDVMDRPPRPPNEGPFARGLWQHVLVFGALTASVCLGLAAWAHDAGRPWQTMLFSTLALLQLGNAFAARSERRSSFGLRANPFLTWSILGSITLQLVLPYLPATRALLTLEPMALGDLLLVLAASSVTFWAIELEKLVLRRLERRGLVER